MTLFVGFCTIVPLLLARLTIAVIVIEKSRAASVERIGDVTYSAMSLNVVR